MEYGAVLLWWAALLALAALGLPLTTWLLRSLPDRGAALALPVAFVGLLVPVHWLGQLHYGGVTVVLGLGLLAGGSALALRRGPRPDLRRFAAWAVVFSLGFALVVAIRALDPSIIPGGGEKFLDYGILNSLLRGEMLPPEDVWFAGEPVAYYYGGHLLVASLSRLTGVPAALAFNLGVATFYAALLGAAYGLAGSVAAARGGPYHWAGSLGAFFVGVASNAVAALQLLIWTLPAPTATRLAEAVAARTAMPAAQLLGPERFWYWTASRVIPGTINEFPLFTYLNGELHGHGMDVPFLVLAAGIGLAYVQTPAAARRRRRLLVLGAAPPVAGVVALTNTWGFPAAVGVVGLAVLFGDAPPRELLPMTIADRLPRTEGTVAELERVGLATLVAVGCALLGLAWVAPFVLGPATGTSTQGIGVLPDRTGLLAFVLVHGWFLLVYGGYLLVRGLGAAEGEDPRTVAMLALLAVAVFGVGFALDAAAVGLLLPPLALAWYLLRRRPDVGFEMVLFVAGAGLLVLVEVLYLREQAGPGRLNTVFKTYQPVWVFWGVGAGASLAAIVPRPRAIETDREWLAAAGLAALLTLASLYGALALSNHVEAGGEPTLDGTVAARAEHPAEWEAIRFVDRLEGQPTMVTAPGCWCNDVESVRPYRWVNAPSSFTGVPTVLGWDASEVGFRGRAVYQRRYADVERIYTGSDGERAAILAAYEVEYVYVGPNERALYDLAALRADPSLSVAFANEQVTIYAVDRPGS